MENGNYRLSFQFTRHRFRALDYVVYVLCHACSEEIIYGRGASSHLQPCRYFLSAQEAELQFEVELNESFIKSK